MLIHFFGSTSKFSRFGERFGDDGQYSLASFLFDVLILNLSPRAQSFVKVGGTCPVPYGVSADG